MSVIATVGKATTGTIAAVAGAQLINAAEASEHPSFWSITLLAIPLGVLVASLAGSAARAYREGAQPDETIARQIGNVTIDGFIGGWLAMFIITFPLTRGTFDGVAPAVLGAFGGLLGQFIRVNGPRWANEAWTAGLSIFSKRQKEGGS